MSEIPQKGTFTNHDSDSPPKDVLSTAGSWVIDAEMEYLRCGKRPMDPMAPWVVKIF